MFFRRRRKKVEQKKQVPLDVKPLIKEKMPIITLDHSWHQLIKEIKTPEIERLEKKLNDLLKEQGKLNTDYVEYTKLKKEMLDKILALTHEAFDLKSEDASEKIQDQQKMIFKINEKLATTEPRLDIVKAEIQETNSTLVDESVNVCYEHINKYRGLSHTLDDEIQAIRTILMKKTEEKKLSDKKSEQLYQYLHQLVGPQFIEKLDNIYWEPSE